MRIVIAPNAFKNSLGAAEVAKCIEEGLMQSRLDCSCVCFPVADGGDGTAELVVDVMGGAIRTGRFHDPLSRNIEASYGLIEEGKTAVIEMAAASGIRLLTPAELNPMLTTSIGTGEMVTDALDRGVKKIILTLGGSGTVDGACGILWALGIRFFDEAGKELSPAPGELENVSRVDISRLDARIADTRIELWCDVQNTLLGKSGAATVFAPQKGATADQVIRLEKFLMKLSDITTHTLGVDVTGIASGGAAGGAGAFLQAYLGAKIVNGIDRFLDLTRFDEVVVDADMVITGEGEIDAQTMHGKGPYGVAIRAYKKNIPVIGLAGKVPLQSDPQLDKLFSALFSIGHQPLPLAELIRLTAPNLVRMSRQIGNLIEKPPREI